MKKKDKKNNDLFLTFMHLLSVIALIMLIIVCVKFIRMQNEIKAYKTEVSYLKGNKETMKSCPLCGSDNVKVYPVNESYYIKCYECELKTNYYNSLLELLDYWNGERHD